MQLLNRRRGGRLTLLTACLFSANVRAEEVSLAPTKEPDRSGRAALVVAASGYGAWVGIAARALSNGFGSCDLFGGPINSQSAPGGCSRDVFVAPVGGLLVGLVGSLAMTHSGPISKAQAWSIITGLDYGTVAGFFLASTATRLNDVALQSAVGIGLGLAALGGWAASHWEPTHGQVEAARSGALWGGTAGLLIAGSWMGAGSGQGKSAVVATGLVGGLLTGAFLASGSNISRNRMLLGDAGALTGLLSSVVAASALGVSKDEVLVGVGLAGMVGGLALSLSLTKQWDAQGASNPQQGSSVSAVWERNPHGNWSAGSLTLIPRFDVVDEQTRLSGAWVPVVGGDW